jgi:hypothetical protein
MRSPSQSRFTLIALVAFCFFILAGCAAQLFGQTNDGKIMIQVFNDDGPATVYYVTPENSKAVGVNSSGVPAMLSVSGSSNLAGLTDVAITSLANLDLLRYDSATFKWKNVPGSTYALSSALSDYLTTANAVSTYQPLDSDLTAIAALNPTSGQVLRRGASAWIATTPGSMFLQNANNVAITGGTIEGLTALDLSGFGITTQEATILPTTGEARLTLGAGGGSAVLFYTGTNSPEYQLRDQATGGFLVSTGDTGTVTNTMLASGIASSKLAPGSATNGQALVYNGTNWAPGTISTGLTIGSTGITGGTSGSVLMSGGTVSEQATTGTGDVVRSASPNLSGVAPSAITGTAIVGAVGSTDNAILRADGTGGGTAQGSAATMTDAGAPTFRNSVTVQKTGGAGVAGLEVATDPLNTGIDAITILTPSNGGRVYFGKSGNLPGSIVYNNANNESFGNIISTAAHYQILSYGATGITLQPFNGAVTLSPLAASGVRITSSHLELDEVTSPAAPAANKARLFIEDNGSGKTRLMVRFPSGATQQISIEP